MCIATAKPYSTSISVHTPHSASGPSTNYERKVSHKKVATKTSSPVGVIFVIAAIIAAGAFLARGVAKKTDEPEYSLTLSLVYYRVQEPPKGPVKVVVKINDRSKASYGDKDAVSPWTRVIPIKPGDKVDFTSSHVRSDYMVMSCTIHDDNGNVYDQKTKPNDALEVTCSASIL